MTVENHTATEDYTWGVVASIIRTDKKGMNRHLKATTLVHFLDHIPEGKPFNYKAVPFADCFGNGDYPLILSWLIENDLIHKEGAKYVVERKVDVRSVFNEAIDNTKL